MYKLSTILIALIILSGCSKDDNPDPIKEDLVLKRVTRYKDGLTDQFYITDYFYDNQGRISRTEASRYTDPMIKSVTNIEYVGDLQINVSFSSGSTVFEIHFNEQGDPISINDDVLSYIYNDNGMIVTATADSQTWTETYIIENGNSMSFSEEPPNWSWNAQYDDKPNYMRSTGFLGGERLRLKCDTNNVTHFIDNQNWEEDYIYEYNQLGYPISIKRTYSSTKSEWSSYSEFKIEY